MIYIYGENWFHAYLTFSMYLGASKKNITKNYFYNFLCRTFLFHNDFRCVQKLSCSDENLNINCSNVFLICKVNKKNPHIFM